LDYEVVCAKLSDMHYVLSKCKFNENHKSITFVRNLSCLYCTQYHTTFFGYTSNKNRSSPITSVIPKSDRRTKMNKLFIDNNRTKNCTNNLNIILIKNKFTNAINCININTGRIRRRNKSSIITKNQTKIKKKDVSLFKN
jgi:hypothetical protein